MKLAWFLLVIITACNAREKELDISSLKYNIPVIQLKPGTSDSFLIAAESPEKLGVHSQHAWRYLDYWKCKKDKNSPHHCRCFIRVKSDLPEKHIQIGILEKGAKKLKNKWENKGIIVIQT